MGSLYHGSTLNLTFFFFSHCKLKGMERGFSLIYFITRCKVLLYKYAYIFNKVKDVFFLIKLFNSMLAGHSTLGWYYTNGLFPILKEMII